MRVPSGPHKSLRRCIINTEYVTLVPAGTKYGRLPTPQGTRVVSLIAVRTLNGLAKITSRLVRVRSVLIGQAYTAGYNLNVSKVKKTCHKDFITQTPILSTHR